MSNTLLVLSGMHGDEYEVIDAVATYIKQQAHILPSLVHIPHVSPSAVSQKTRKNKWGSDVNRNFFDDTTDPEVKTVMKKVLPYHFDLCLDFHEDPDLKNEFYMYDSGLLPDKSLGVFREHIMGTGATLYSGIDDELDKTLGLHIQDGYISAPTISTDAGFSLGWLVSHGVVTRMFTLEIPGKAPVKLKRKLVAAVFDTIVIRDVAQLASARRLGR